MIPIPQEKCFVKYCHGRWHRLSAVGGVWQCKAFSLIKLPNNHLSGFHIFCCIGDPPTSVASLPEKRGKEFWEFLALRRLCFSSSFIEVGENRRRLAGPFHSTTHCFGEKSRFHRWQQKSHFLSPGTFGFNVAFFYLNEPWITSADGDKVRWRRRFENLKNNWTPLQQCLDMLVPANPLPPCHVPQKEGQGTLLFTDKCNESSFPWHRRGRACS